MIDQIRHLLAFSNTARYNIKAVVQQTQVNVSTLRAWEQRYGVPRPTRTEHGHRLYSQRDIEIIKWLKKATEDGIAISQAVSLLQSDQEQIPDPGMQAVEPARARMLHVGDAGWPDLRHQISDALVSANIRQAHALMNTAMTLFPVDALVHDVILPILSELGDRWMYGNEYTLQLQIAVQFVRQRLMNLLQVHASFGSGPRVLCGTTTNDEHDIASLIFSVLLEQQSWEVVHIGPNIGIHGISELMVTQTPAILVLSASMVDHVVSLQQIGQLMVSLHHHGLRFAYAGRAFVQNPELCRRMPGTYLGDDFVTASQTLQVIGDELMASGTFATREQRGRVRLGMQ